MDFRISDLKNFISTANVRTMREGSEKLEISQPALSESIKRLEKDIGEILFYRSRSGVELTPAGKQVFVKAKEALSALKSVSEMTSQKRSITIGCHQVIASYFLPKALRIMQNLNANYQIHLRHDLSRIIQLEVQQGKIDVGIVVNAVSSPDLVIKNLGIDEVCVWQNKKFHQNVKDQLFCETSLFQTQSIFRKWKNKPINIINTESLELIARFVNEGLGYGILPARVVSLLKFDDLCIAPKTPIFKDTISIVYRPEFGKNTLEKSIIESLKKSVAESESI